MLASHVMTKNVQTLPDTATVYDALNLLVNSALDDFPVVNKNGQPVGIVSAKSIVHHAIPDYATTNFLAAMQAAPDIKSIYKKIEHIVDHPILEVADTHFTTVKPTTATSAVAAILANLTGDTHHVLVVDDAGKLLGIISARDILRRHLKNINA